LQQIKRKFSSEDSPKKSSRRKQEADSGHHLPGIGLCKNHISFNHQSGLFLPLEKDQLFVISKLSNKEILKDLKRWSYIYYKLFQAIFNIKRVIVCVYACVVYARTHARAS